MHGKKMDGGVEWLDGQLLHVWMDGWTHGRIYE
jgi:hypothetical protein